jgi:hypothetical protein
MKFQLADYSKLESDHITDRLVCQEFSAVMFQPSLVSHQERHFHGVAAGQFSLRAIRRARFAFPHSGERKRAKGKVGRFDRSR